jgi:hypothetical protein
MQFKIKPGKLLVDANSRVTGWYQLLAEGKATVFKQIKKQVSENKPYGSD